MPSAVAQAPAEGTSFAVVVVDEAGRGIAGAAVILRPEFSEPVELPPPFFTDATGRVTLEGLTQGEWQVEVRRAGYMIFSAFVKLVAGLPPVVGFSSRQRTGTFWAPLEVEFEGVGVDLASARSGLDGLDKSERRQLAKAAEEALKEQKRAEKRRRQEEKQQDRVARREPAPIPTTRGGEAATLEEPVRIAQAPPPTPTAISQERAPTPTPTPLPEVAAPPSVAPAEEPNVEVSRASAEDPPSPASFPEPAAEPQAPARSEPAPAVPTAAPVEQAAVDATEIPIPDSDEASSGGPAPSPSPSPPTVPELPDDSEPDEVLSATPPAGVDAAVAVERPAPPSTVEVQRTTAPAVDAPRAVPPSVDVLRTPPPSAGDPPPPVAPASDAPPPVGDGPTPGSPTTGSSFFPPVTDRGEIATAATSTPSQSDVGSLTPSVETAARPAAGTAAVPVPDPDPPTRSVSIPRRRTVPAISAQPYLFEGGACPECKTGEWALVVERVAARSEGGAEDCGAGRADRVDDVVSEILVPGAGALTSYAGPLADAHGNGISALFDDVEESPGLSALTRSGACQDFVAILPAGARFVGFRLEIEDETGKGQCFGSDPCSLGDAHWLGVPEIDSTASSTVIHASFLNESRARERRGRLVILFMPVSGWRPP